MGTNWATPDDLGALASAADGAAGNVEEWGTAAGWECAAHGYSYAATTTGGSTAGAGRWATAWAASLRQRETLLEQYDAIALLGSGAAGGAGPALGAARIWALSEPGTLDFAEWYRITVAAAIERRRQVELGLDLAERVQSVELLDDPLAIADAVDAASPIALAALFEDLGVVGTREVLRWIYPLDPISRSLPDALDEALAGALNRAWPELDEDYRFSLIESAADWDILYHVGLLGRFTGEYWGLLGAKIVGEGPRTDYARNPTNSLYTYGGVIRDLRDRLEADAHAAAALAAAPGLWMARGTDDEFPMEDWIAGLISTQVGAMDDDGFLEFAEALLMAMAAIGPDDLRDGVVGGLAADLVMSRDLDAADEATLTGLLVLAAGSGGVVDELVTPLARLLVTHLDAILPAVAGFDVVSGAVFTLPDSGRVVELSEAELEGALRLVAEHEAAMAMVLEGMAAHFATAIAASGRFADDLDAELQMTAMQLGALSGALVRAINDADIDDAKERDESRAAILGVISIIVAAIPVPGSGLASQGLEGAGKRLISATYSDMKRRGLELLETSNEGVARVEADEFKELFKSQMTVLLVVGHLEATGTLDDAVADFFGSRPELADSRYDFTAGGAVDLDDAYQRLAFNAFLQWVIASNADLHIAVLVLADAFTAEIPTWSD